MSKYEFLKWAHRWEFLIAMYLSVILGSLLGGIPVMLRGVFLPVYFGVVLIFFLFIGITLAIADIAFKYREVEINRVFYSPITLEDWENKIEIIDEEGSANVKVKKILTLEDCEDFSAFIFDYWSDSGGDEIQYLSLKVNGKDNPLNPLDASTRTTTANDAQYKNLKLKVKLDSRKPTHEICCEFKYPPGAFKKALTNKLDFFDLRVYHPTRHLTVFLELGKDLAGKYKIDKPSFNVFDLNDNRIGKMEEELKQNRLIPLKHRNGILWEIPTPKVGLNYRLGFRLYPS